MWGRQKASIGTGVIVEAEATNTENDLRRQKLRKDLLDMQERVGRIITQHDLVNNQHGELGDLANQLKQIIEKIHLTCEESSQNADEMVSHGERLTTISDEFSTLSLEGKQSLHDVVELVTGLQQDAVTTTESMKRLEERSVEITGIVQVISDIASNTNLLALNAAIEAARAGEHGRGFAVVADEVRKLAEMTSHSTKNIATLVETIIGETSNAIAHTYRNKEAIQNGLAACEGAFQKIGEIVHAFDEVREEVSVVKNRIQNQKSLSNRIDSGMGDVNEVLSAVHNKIVSHIQEASIVDRELDASYEKLRRLVEQEVL